MLQKKEGLARRARLFPLNPVIINDATPFVPAGPCAAPSLQGSAATRGPYLSTAWPPLSARAGRFRSVSVRVGVSKRDEFCMPARVRFRVTVKVIDGTRARFRVRVKVKATRFTSRMRRAGVEVI